MSPDPSSSDDKTTFTPAPSGEGAARPASSRAGSSGPGWTPPTIEALQGMLPQYEIISMVGRGGMGAVYKGKQLSLDRMVAIKILPPGLDDAGAEFTARFKNEARLMARLNHPGVVSVHDFGETAEGQFYFVMEYVDGTDVARMISTSGRLPADYALTITAHVCDALGYAHANGVIHRDIKPANILINKQGQVKVTDFGLARQEDASLTAGLTKTGVTMGTPDFIAPEALTLGADVDGRADLYAVGVMLYQMLTGDIPRGLFLMPSVKTKGEIDPRFDRIITRAMQTEREERYQQASEIRKDLDIIQSSPRLKQDASKVLAAVPQAAIENVPGQRSAAGARQKAESGKQKSKSGLYLGIAAIVVVIGATVFMRSGTRQRSDQAASNTPPVGSLATSATSDGWTDGLAEWLAVPSNASSGKLSAEGSAWRAIKEANVDLGINLPRKALANVAVRVTWRKPADTGGYPGAIIINLRDQVTGGAFYAAAMFDNGPTEIRIGNTATPGKFKSPAGFKKTEASSHTLEFRAQGDVLTILVDGQMAGSVKDSTYATGSFAVLCNGNVIEKIEYRDLGSAPAASLATASAVPWQDWLADVRKKNLWGQPSWNDDGTRVEWLRPASMTYTKTAARDQAVRVTWTASSAEDKPNSIDLRTTPTTENRPESYYRFYIQHDGGIWLAIMLLPPAVQPLRAWPAPAGFDPKAAQTYEFRAVGETLSAFVGGQLIGSLTDGRLKEGFPSIRGETGTVMTALEYAVLDGVSAPVAESASVPRAAEPAKDSASATAKDSATTPAPSPTDPKLIALLQNYTKAITKGLASATPADKPAFEAELARLKNNAPLPDAAEDAKLPAELKRLRGILRAQIK